MAAVFMCRSLVQGSFLPLTTGQHVEKSGAVFQGVVEQVGSFEEEGSIWTHATVRVGEIFKGKLPASVEIVYPGGELADKGERACSFPDLKPGEEGIFFISRGNSGKLGFTRGLESAARTKPGQKQPLLTEIRKHAAGRILPGEDFTSETASLNLASEPPLLDPELDSTATNLMSEARFLQPDGGGKIPYLIDNDFLPAGITVSQAVWAVSAALNAWTNVSSARFEFAGFQSFGTNAAKVPASDSVLRIQLHDHYAALTGALELGEGGRAWSIQTTPSGWTTGGRVAGTDFHKVVRGYITLKHTNSVMSKLTTFTEVLTHEIGHVLGLDHSSTQNPEPNQLLREAVMYWIVHDDGRGASLNSWDINVCRQIHPLNSPPVCFSRCMDIVTSPIIPLNVPGVNMIRVPAYDLQTSFPTIEIADATSGNGAFSLSNSNVVYVPNAAYADTGRFDPSSGQAWDRVKVRSSDGLNASPWAEVTVVSFNLDNYNEGVPDSWRNSWFGSPNPNSGINHEANDDADGDGYTNIREWRMFSNPTDPASNLRITNINGASLQFQARGYDVYEVFRSPDLTTWVLDLPAVVGQGLTGSHKFDSMQAARGFFRIRRVE